MSSMSSALDDELLVLMQSRDLKGTNDQEDDQETLIKFMAQRIEEMMSGDFEALMSMMYRLDVAESKIRQALAPGNLENPARGLAKLIIERQKQRMETREKYRQNSSDWIDLE